MLNPLVLCLKNHSCTHLSLVYADMSFRYVKRGWKVKWLGSTLTCCLLKWHIKHTYLEQADMAVMNLKQCTGVSPDTEQQTNLTYCLIYLTTKQCSRGLWASFPDNFVNSLHHLGTHNWSLWILMRDLGVMPWLWWLWLNWESHIIVRNW